MTHNTRTTPRIYVACLAAYNNGYLHGAWIDADQSPEAINAEVQTMLLRSPIPHAEEYAIHDHEGLGDSVGEYSSLNHISAMAGFIAEHSELGEVVLDHCSGDVPAAQAMMERYLGCYSDLADYAEELTLDTTVIPEHLRYYIDYDAMAKDMRLNGDIDVIETAFDQHHIFMRE